MRGPGFLSVWLLASAFLASWNGCSRPQPTPQSEPIEIPTVRYDDIPELDFCVEGDSVLHIAFIAEMRDSAKSGGELLHAWYARYDLIRHVAQKPVHLSRVDRGSIRILRTKSSLHILLPTTLRDFVPIDGGRNWRERKPLLGESDTWKFDAVAMGDTLVVACMIDDRTKVRAREPDSVCVLSISATERSVAVHDLATVEGNVISVPNPRLLTSRTGLDLFFGTSHRTRDTSSVDGRRIIQVRYDPRLFHASRLGDRWAVRGLGPLSRVVEGRLVAQSGILEELDVARQGEEWLIFYVSYVLYAASVDSQDSLTPIIPVASRVAGVRNEGYTMRGIGVDGNIAAWIDTRYTRMGTFLGVLLHLSRTNWFSTDALCSSIAAPFPLLATQLPRALTPPSSYVRRLRVRAGLKHTYVVWAGRKKVGNTLDEYGAPPSLFLATP